MNNAKSCTNYKVCLMGPAQVGKTRVVRKLSNTYTPIRSYRPTLGIEVWPIRLRVCSNATLALWDMAGDPRFKGWGDGYLKKANLCVIYDPTYNSSVPNAFVQSAQRMQVSHVIVGNDAQAINAIHNQNFV